MTYLEEWLEHFLLGCTDVSSDPKPIRCSPLSTFQTDMCPLVAILQHLYHCPSVLFVFLQTLLHGHSSIFLSNELQGAVGKINEILFEYNLLEMP